MAMLTSTLTLLATLLQDPANPSVADFLRTRHMPHEPSGRAVIYAELVDKTAKYTGTDAQNTKLLEALRSLEGKTRRDLASIEKQAGTTASADFSFVRWAPVEGIGVHATFAVRVEVDADKKAGALADRGVYVVVSSASAQLAKFSATGTVEVEVNGKASTWRLQPAWFATIGPDDKAIRLYGEKDKKVSFGPDDRVVVRFEVQPSLRLDGGASPIWPGKGEVVLQEGKKAETKEPAKQEMLLMFRAEAPGLRASRAQTQDAESANLKTAREVEKANEKKTYGTFDCTQFVWAVVEALAKRDGVKVPAGLEATVKVQIKEIGDLEDKAKSDALDKLVEGEKPDARIAGVQKALVDHNLGVVVTAEQAQAGDLVQYWYKRKDEHWSGHAAVIVAKKPTNNGDYEFTILGSHLSKAKKRAVEAKKTEEDAKLFPGIGTITVTFLKNPTHAYFVRWQGKAAK
jgi:hypothetical protein